VRTIGAQVLQRIGGIPDALRGRDDVWLVGGAVRDALLGREPRELDFVVEGDAVALARSLGGPVTVHERFGTAHAGGIDLASARTEHYAHPGALPDVALGATAQEDLARRDFTVNAIAVRLSDAEIAAWPGAIDDLDAGVLRVLHERSFEDDPTRMLRLARYAARLGFRPDPRTARLADSGRVDTVTGGRLGEEVRLLMGEPQPEALEWLARAGHGDEVLGPHFDVDSDLVRAVFAGTHPSGLAALAACLWTAPPDRLRARLDDLAFPAAERDVVVAAATRAGPLAERLRSVASGPPSAIWSACRAERPETVALAGALAGGPGEEAARRWIEELRFVRPAIDGDDLVRAGLRGPEVGRGLERATAALLDGRADTAVKQLEAALTSNG
jgi:tRNA nucleotidyltransferase (CCA-adding enzyme)